MDIFHVQVVRGNGVGDRIRCEDLRLFDGVSIVSIIRTQADSRCHQLWVEVEGVVAQLGFSDGFQTLTSLGQV